MASWLTELAITVATAVPQIKLKAICHQETQVSASFRLEAVFGHVHWLPRPIH